MANLRGTKYIFQNNSFKYRMGILLYIMFNHSYGFRFDQWKKDMRALYHEDKLKLVVLEVGAGKAVPTVR